MQTLHPHVTCFRTWPILPRWNLEGERVIAFDWRQMLIFLFVVTPIFDTLFILAIIPIAWKFSRRHQIGNVRPSVRRSDGSHRLPRRGRRSPSVDVRCWAGTSSFELLNRTPVHIHRGGPLERSGQKARREKPNLQNRMGGKKAEECTKNQYKS